MIDPIDKACDCVRSGGVIAYPTEGVFGVGCDPKNEAALERLIRLKRRDPKKGLILIASELEMLSDYIQPLDEPMRKRVQTTWPGPVTWVLPAKPQVPVSVTGGRASVAARVTNHPQVRQLCDSLGHALVSSSANFSGEAAIRNLKELQETLGDIVDYIVPGELGELTQATPIYDVLTGKQLR